MFGPLSFVHSFSVVSRFGTIGEFQAILNTLKAGAVDVNLLLTTMAFIFFMNSRSFELQVFHPKLDFITARQLLEECNWDMQAATTKFVQGQQIRLRLGAKANDCLLSVETFGKHDEGMAIIYFLNAQAPVNAG